MKPDHIFLIKLLCDYSQWWRYNVFMTVVCYDGDNNIVGYESMNDAPLEVETGGEHRSQPADYDASRVVSLRSVACDHISLFVYVIANTFPDSRLVREFPPFDALITVGVDDNEVDRIDIEINQWGGATLVAHEVFCK